MFPPKEVLPSKLQYETFHEIFEAQVDAKPDAVAVLFEEKKITYYDLEQRANRLARHLRAQGIQQGSLVAILLPRSVDAYVSILAVLKAGAAYVPIDPEYPSDRVAYILKDAGVSALLTTVKLAKHHTSFSGVVVRVDADHTTINAESPKRLLARDVGVRSQDLCYVIYTSGSTGQPKGVQVEHRSACNLVLAEGKIFQVRPDDRVCQAASLSFDLSIEEIWLAFHAGATLVAATQRIEQSGSDFSRFLTENGITILSCVPTLLSMLEEEVPSLRLIILGGETCPDWLVSRWARPERRIVNTYGPTETTVIATYADLHPGKPVTIGHAVPGYRVYVLDDSLKPVPNGTIGEICIGGIGVARGYVGLLKETHNRFLHDMFAPTDEVDARMYLTGDLGRINIDGNLEFIGRNDAQVKLRGFRIDLTEIESVLMQYPNILAAACTVREDIPGIQKLVGYIIPRNGNTIDEDLIRSYLQNRFPNFMIPSLIETVSDLPLLPSGKLDRASLPSPKPRKDVLQSFQRPHTKTEQKITEIWETLFQPQPVSINDNFFLDLGGHSLFAARMVSEMRKDPKFAHVSVADVYKYPTIESLASMLDAATFQLQSSKKTMTAAVRHQEPHTNKQGGHLLATIMQLVGLYPVFAVMAFEWITPYLIFFLLLAKGYSILNAVGWAAVSVVTVFPLLLVATVAAKWLLLGRIRPGRYPLWGNYYLRWWFVQTLVSSLPLRYLAGTPLLPFVYRILGARIGKDVHLGTESIAAFDLISIGDGSSIDDKASLLGYTVEDGSLVIGEIRIGRDCYVGTRSSLRENTIMNDGARLEDLSFLPHSMQIPGGQTWAGSPAQFVSNSMSMQARPQTKGPIRRATTTILYGALVMLLPLVLFLAVVPGVSLLFSINTITNPFFYLPAIPLVGASFVFFITIEIILLKWLVVGRVRPGTYPVHSSFYVRNWIVDKLLELSLDLIAPLRSTLYLAPWYRALGSKIGRFVELSNVSSNTPDLLEVGDESTIADEVSLGGSRIEGGWLTVAPTRLGCRTFVGNNAVIPANTVMGDNSLLGVLSLSPPKPEDASRASTSWLGSPPVFLPRRQSCSAFSEEKTFRPTRKLRLTRGSIEIFRITLPSAGFVLFAAAVIGLVFDFSQHIGLGAALLSLPLVYAACCVAVLLAVVLAKWIVVGHFRPFAHPLWNTFIWRLEFVNALYEFLATPLVLNALTGTALLPAYLRLLGAKIGRGVYMKTTGLIEFDLVEIGDRAALNDNCVLQTHLFEDRIMKASKVNIGTDCSLGANSIVLYDSKMEDGSKLDDLSLLMKGEVLPTGTAWAGLPARRSYDRFA